MFAEIVTEKTKIITAIPEAPNLEFRQVRQVEDCLDQLIREGGG